MPQSDDYDSPWKDAIERYFPEFLKFFFPAAHGEVDWSKEHVFLDQELLAVTPDAELGRRHVDKLVRVTGLGGEARQIFVHIEVQGEPAQNFAERMFVYNYRLYDRHRSPVASLAVLADDRLGWKPDAFRFEVFGCRHSLEFPTAKLLDWAGREDELLADENPFALVTAAHLLTRATRQDMNARFAAKWRLVRVLFERGWDRQRVVDLFAVIDWMMRLPDDLARRLLGNIAAFEERTAMRYVTSVERILSWSKGTTRGPQEGARGPARGRGGPAHASAGAALRRSSGLGARPRPIRRLRRAGNMERAAAGGVVGGGGFSIARTRYPLPISGSL